MIKYILLLFSLFHLYCSQAQQPGSYRPFNGKEQTLLLATGVSVTYVEQGNENGTPVILLHGFTDSWHSFEMVLPYFSPGLHVFAITQRGHGSSGKPETGYHPKDFAADLAAFMKQKKITRAVIAGHSMGGMIAQQFTLDHPSMVKGLVIVGSDASFRDNPGVPEFSAEINRLTDTVNYDFVHAFQQYTCAHPIDSAFYRVIIGESMKLPGRVWKAAMNGMLDVDLTGRLTEVSAPVLILWGSKDFFCTKDDQDRMKKQMPQAELVIYDDTGHSMHWEQPAKFAADLSSFIKKTARDQ